MRAIPHAQVDELRPTVLGAHGVGHAAAVPLELRDDAPHVRRRHARDAALERRPPTLAVRPPIPDTGERFLARLRGHLRLHHDGRACEARVQRRHGAETALEELVFDGRALAVRVLLHERAEVDEATALEARRVRAQVGAQRAERHSQRIGMRRSHPAVA